MKKIILICTLLFSFFFSFSQTGNDTTKYIFYRYQYGQRMARLWGDTVLMPPRDTAYSKYGIAIKGNNFYFGNGTIWSSVLSNGFAAGGDLSGTYPSPTVAKIQGVGVSTTAPTTGQGLVYNGTQWTPTMMRIAALDSLAKSVNGLQIVGGNIFVPQSADASFPGLVTTGSQTWAGLKTFNGGVYVPGVNGYSLISPTVFQNQMANNTATDTTIATINFNGASDAVVAYGGHRYGSRSYAISPRSVIGMSLGRSAVAADSVPSFQVGLASGTASPNVNAGPTTIFFKVDSLGKVYAPLLRLGTPGASDSGVYRNASNGEFFYGPKNTGGGATPGLQAVLNVYAKKGVAITDTTVSDTLGYIRWIGQPSNYNTNYGTYGGYGGIGTAGRFTSGWTRFNGVNGSGRPNVVGSMWGYNVQPGGAPLIANEGAFDFRTETHYELSNKMFELHLPEFTDTAGVAHRIFSFYIPKNGKTPTGPQLEGNGIGFVTWGNQNETWGTFSDQGIIKAMVARKPATTYPELTLGSLRDTVNGTPWPNGKWDYKIMVGGQGTQFGHINTVTADNPISRFTDNLYVGQNNSAATERSIVLYGTANFSTQQNFTTLSVDNTGPTQDEVLLVAKNGTRRFTVNNSGVYPYVPLDLGNYNSYFGLVSGTTAQRPASPQTRYMRMNTDSANHIEVYDATYGGYRLLSYKDEIKPATVKIQGSYLTVNATKDTLSFDSTQVYHRLFSATAVQTVSNSATATTLFPTVAGAKSIPANSLKVGSMFTIKGGGVISTTGTPTTTFSFSPGSLNITPPTASLSSAFVDYEITYTVTAVGATGAMQGIGWVSINGTKTGTSFSSIALNTTIANTLDATVQFSVAAAGNTISNYLGEGATK